MDKLTASNRVKNVHRIDRNRGSFSGGDKYSIGYSCGRQALECGHRGHRVWADHGYRVFLLKYALGMIGVMKYVSRKTLRKLLPFLLELNNDYTFLRIKFMRTSG